MRVLRRIVLAALLSFAAVSAAEELPRASSPEEVGFSSVRLHRLPLAYQPGTMFEYGMSTDVVGRIVEVQSGLDLATFFAERITKPLGMPDTSFRLTGAQVERLAEPQPRDKSGPAVIVGYNPARPPNWFSGGGGLLSTAMDYARFCQMLLNDGELGSVRILSRKAVQLMRSNHLPPDIGYGGFTAELGMTAPLPALGQGYGLGVGVRVEEGRGTVPGDPSAIISGAALRVRTTGSIQPRSW